MAWTKEGNAKALELIQRALALDPRFAAGHIELALIYRQQIDAGFAGSVDEAMARWLETATTAVDLDPTYRLGAAGARHRYVYAGEFDLAAPELERALELAPGNARILGAVAEQLPWMGQPERAVELVERAVRLDPSSFTEMCSGRPTSSRVDSRKSAAAVEGKAALPAGRRSLPP